MDNIFLCYSKCSTCKKAYKKLNDMNIEVKYRDLVTEKLDKKEIEDQYIKEILGNYSDVNTQAQKAVLAANEAGGRDNITVAIAKYLVREEVA